MKKLLLFTSLIFLTTAIYAQSLVDATFLIHHTKSQVTLHYGLPPAFVRNGVNLYKLTYNTTSIEGTPEVASGLVVVPDDVAAFPLLCYQHGTVSSRNQVPSVLGFDGYPSGDDLGVVFSSFGYVVAAADYQGLGDSPGFHPYVHADSEATAAIDLLYATREFMLSIEAELNDQLFITGYSQGGHAAMAAYREIQQNLPQDFSVTAAAPMSGPYSISGAMRDVILSDDQYLFAGYLPNTLLSYDRAYGLFEEIEEYFKQPYATWIESYYNEQTDLFSLNFQLLAQLLIEAGGYFPKHMLQDSIIDAATNNENHPLNVALRDNDVYDWTPMSPTRIYYCTADDQVTYRNSIIADSVMQMNGAPDLETIDVDPSADHGGCVNPAVTSALFFFAGFQEIGDVTTSTQQPIVGSEALSISPNPASSFTEIQWMGKDADLVVYNSNGQRLLQQAILPGLTRLAVQDWPKGLYFVLISDGTQSAIEKIVVE